jgi:hypothetical protein
MDNRSRSISLAGQRSAVVRPLAARMKILLAAPILSTFLLPVILAMSGSAGAGVEPRSAAEGYPRGIDYNATNDRLVESHYLRRSIRELDSTGRLIASAPFGTGRGPGARTLRIKIDSARGRLWVLDIGDLYVYDTATRRLIRRVPLPGWFTARINCIADMALDGSGALFISNNILPKLWRVDPMTFRVTEHNLILSGDQGRDMGFSGLAFAGDPDGPYAVDAVSGSLWRIDIRNDRAYQVELSAPVRGACALASRTEGAGQDLKLFVLVANGFPNDVQRIDLSADRKEGRVTARIMADSVSMPAGLVTVKDHIYALDLRPAAPPKAGGRGKPDLAFHFIRVK